MSPGGFSYKEDLQLAPCPAPNLKPFNHFQEYIFLLEILCTVCLLSCHSWVNDSNRNYFLFLWYELASIALMESMSILAHNFHESLSGVLRWGNATFKYFKVEIWQLHGHSLLCECFAEVSSQSVFEMWSLNWLTWELLGRSSSTLANAVLSLTWIGHHVLHANQGYRICGFC